MNSPIKTCSDRAFPHRLKEAGFSLIEMMIAITIGLVILAALVGVLATSSGNSPTNDRTSELMTNGRFALNSMKQELRQAGYRGYTSVDPMPPVALGAISGECMESVVTAGTFVSNIRQGVWGANDSNPFPANCIPTTNFASGNDILVVRRLEEIPPPKTLVSNTLYFQSTYAAGQMFRGTTAPNLSNPSAPTGTPDTSTPLGTFAVKTYVYYISPFTVSVTESPPIPALFRVALNSDGTNNPTMAAELVASGIEHMQVQYGVLLNPGTATETTQYFDTLIGTSLDTTATAWDNVNSVRIWLLARNSTAEPGYSNTTSYSMGNKTGGNAYTVSDGFRRQLFTTVVQLRN